MEIPEMGKQNEEKFFLLKTNAFESVTTNSHNPEQDTSHWRSMCYETPLRFKIKLRETFSKSSFLRMTKIYDKSALMLALQEFGTL